MRGTDTPPVARLAHLDGLRALAVLMVMAYHGGVPGLGRGGFLGVDVFFVLSGFLITGLLLAEQGDTGRIALVAFWGRRARRLLPALVVLLVALDVYVRWWTPPGRYPGFGGDVLSVALYFSNWHLVAGASNYFAASAAPSLLTHTWSLAIEEQFYLAWPLVLLAVRAGCRRSGRDPRTAVAALAAAGALASTGWAAWLYHHGASASRLYYGTDTHAQGLLVGAALAAWTARTRAPASGSAIAARPPTAAGDPTAAPARPPGPRRAGPAAGIALVGLVVLAVTVRGNGPVVWQGGFLAADVLTAVVLAATAVASRSVPVRLLSARPAAYLGRISYGMYLWYFPVFAVLDGAATGLVGLPLLAVRIAVDVALAAASHHLVEVPAQQAMRPRPGRAGRWRPIAVGAVALAAVMVFVDTGGGAGPAAAAPTVPDPGPVTSTGAGAGGPVRVLVVGDSTALTLALGLSTPAAEQNYGYTVSSGADLGCGVAVSAEVSEDGTVLAPSAPCDSSTPAGRQWPAGLRAEVARLRPQVVLVAAGRWELLDRRATPGGPWLDITGATDAAYVTGQLELAGRIAAAGGARVALATTPCFSTGEQADGRPWPDEDSRRVAAYDAAVRRAAAAVPQASVVDLGAQVCPHGSFHTHLDGIVVRAPDGIHYPFFSIADPGRADPDTLAQTEVFGAWMAARIMPGLVASGRAAGP